MYIKKLFSEAMDDLDELFGEGYAEENPEMVFRYLSLDAERDRICILADQVYGVDEDYECDDCKREREEKEAKEVKLNKN